MTESEFKDVLNEIGTVFHVQKIGSTGNTWIAIGEIFENRHEDEILTRLKKLPISWNLKQTDGVFWLTVEDKKRMIFNIPPIHIVLFLTTVMTTLLAGSFMAGGNPFVQINDIIKGVPFSFTLLLILGTHEFGHYFFAKKHQVSATLPYFIPAPFFFPFGIGTFGAIIRIKSPIQNKRALLEIGAAGPIAGFLVAVPVLIIGLINSTIVSDFGSALLLGDSLLMKFLTSVIFPNIAEHEDIMLHPVAFSGWIGLLVTMLNLLPIGQLDGGHIAYAMLGDKQIWLARFMFLCLIPLSFLSLNWLFWAILILLLMRTVKHPPILEMNNLLSARDKFIGIVSLAIFLICFIPVPFGG